MKSANSICIPIALFAPSPRRLDAEQCGAALALSLGETLARPK
jgi:hypothetical protein